MRLIDADKLGIKEAGKEAYNEFLEHSKKYGNTSVQTYCYLAGRADGLIDATGRVKFAPTIDATPVIRCGECVHRFVDGDNVRFNVCELNHNKVQSDDWFCADGERRDDATD